MKPATDIDRAEIAALAKKLWLRVLETDQQVVYLEGEPDGTCLFLSIAHVGMQNQVRRLVTDHAKKGIPHTVRRVPGGLT